MSPGEELVEVAQFLVKLVILGRGDEDDFVGAVFLYFFLKGEDSAI